MLTKGQISIISLFDPVKWQKHVQSWTSEAFPPSGIGEKCQTYNFQPNWTNTFHLLKWNTKKNEHASYNSHPPPKKKKENLAKMWAHTKGKQNSESWQTFIKHSTRKCMTLHKSFQVNPKKGKKNTFIVATRLNLKEKKSLC